MRLKRTRPTDAGFTLVELLAVIVVLGSVVAIFAQGFRFAIQTFFWMSNQDDGAMPAVEQAFDHLVEQADPGVYPLPATLRGMADTLALTTELPQGGSGLQMRADAVLSASGGRLVLRWRPHAHVVWFGPGPGWTETVLADGVDRVEFAYHDRVRGAAWSNSWTGEHLPALVRMTLVFAGSKTRHWPPVIAAALREPIEE